MYIRNWVSPKNMDNFVLNHLNFFSFLFYSGAGIFTFVEINQNSTCGALAEFNSYSMVRSGPKLFKIELSALGDSNPQLSALKEVFRSLFINLPKLPG